MADAGEIAYPYSTREAVALVKHLQSFPSDGLLAAAENVFAFDGHEPAIAQTITSVLRRHGVPAGGGAGAFDVRLAAEEDLPPSEPLELWSAGGSGGAEVPLQAVEVGGEPMLLQRELRELGQVEVQLRGPRGRLHSCLPASLRLPSGPAANPPFLRMGKDKRHQRAPVSLDACSLARNTGQ